MRVARASRYSESLKVVAEVFDERPIVFPGVGEEDFWPPWLLIGANNLSRQFDSITLQTQTPLASTIHRCWTRIGWEIALPPPICSAFHKRSSGSASLLPHERVIRSRLRSPSLSNGNSPLRRNRRSGSRHIPQSPFDRHRGGGHPPTPATPPCIRVRTRRFKKVALTVLE